MLGESQCAISPKPLLICGAWLLMRLQPAPYVAGGEIRRAGVGLVLEARGRGPASVAELAPGKTTVNRLKIELV
jgi:hypothetical protein